MPCDRMSEFKQRPNDLTKVFVYGTLKPGEANYQIYCAGKVLSAKRAIALGQLFALPLGYPAMTLGSSPVQGYLLSFANSEILSHLDWLEGYDPQRPTIENEYNRQEIETFSTDFAWLGLAWTYLMTLEQVHCFGGVLVSDGWWSAFTH